MDPLFHLLLFVYPTHSRLCALPLSHLAATPWLRKSSRSHLSFVVQAEFVALLTSNCIFLFRFNPPARPRASIQYSRFLRRCPFPTPIPGPSHQAAKPCNPGCPRVGPSLLPMLLLARPASFSKKTLPLQVFVPPPQLALGEELAAIRATAVLTAVAAL